ncbi:dienelactone hydrolase family protein [Sphingomonas sp. LT1P40]|uniref:dienelactone hydrolase family protein n=1 Tax=Alteristakelama amylovorans TaxID=3096166 RepID=UPI002FCC7F37
MCDELTAADNEKLNGGISRRDFGIMAGGVGLAALLPAPANAQAVKGRDVTFAVPGGTADGYFVAPATGKHPAVLVWPDVMGMRPAFRQMADRLAQSGYAVLTVNPFYRSVAGQFLKPGESWGDPAIRAKVGPWRALLTPDAVVSDATAYVGWLDKQTEVNRKRGVGTTGYCMGGPFTMRTAAALPKRVRAGASFHGGGIGTDKPDSPHLLVPKMKADFLFAVAENDDQRNPNEKELVRKAFADAKRAAEIEVYAGAQHGWCPPDSQAYNQVQAEKAWGRLLALFDKAL